jgi:hypothetical protein
MDLGAAILRAGARLVLWPIKPARLARALVCWWAP